MKFADYPYITLIILCIILSACTVKNTQAPVARVFDKFLYADDLVSVVQPSSPPKDSTQVVHAFINSWIRKNLIMKKAELNLREEMTGIEKQLEDYKTSLIVYAYEKELVNQKLDTNISDQEIESYYKKNLSEFELKDYIVKVLYIKLEKNSPELNKVKKWYLSGNPEDLKKLEDYCRKFAVNFFVDTEVWLFFDDLLKEIPIDTYNKEEFLKNYKPVEFEDKEYLYLLNILDYRLKDDISPLSLVQENIRNILVNKRKLSLIETMRNDIYQDALERGNFEIY